MVCVEIQINNILLTNALILDHLSGSTWLVDGFGASKFVTRYAVHITSNFIHGKKVFKSFPTPTCMYIIYNLTC